MLLTIAIILLLIVVVLAAPVSMKFQLAIRNGSQGVIDIRMLYGLIKTQARFPKPANSETRDKDNDEKLDLSEEAPQTGGMSVFALIRQRPFRRRIIKFVSDTWRAIEKRDIRIRMRIGLGDPADTGRLWAIAGPASGLLASLPNSIIVLEPEFYDMTFEFDGSGSICFTPLSLIYHVAALALSPVVWRTFLQHRKRTT